MILPRFSNQYYRCNSIKVNNTRCLVLSYNTPIETPKTRPLGNTSIYEFRWLQSPDQLGKSLRRCSNFKAISYLKTEAKYFARGSITAQSVHRSTTWIWQLKHFQRVPTRISLCPLRRHTYLVVPITQSTFLPACVLPLGKKGLIINFTSFSSMILEKFRVFSSKTNLSYHNCGILQK